MQQTVQYEQAKNTNRLLIWTIGLAGLVLLSVVLGWFDDTTELVPPHDDASAAVFYLAGVSGLISGGIAIKLSRKIIVWPRVVITLSFVLLGLLSGFMMSYQIAKLVDGIMDFPPTKTRTSSALVLISRAYQTHGKGGNWNIQTTPLWSNLAITEDDYNFMLAHRPDEDRSQNPDEILSKGLFCAQVTVQQAGSALRIMHAGSRKLPKGTVIICPPRSGNSHTN